jgi:hypothetical protein
MSCTSQNARCELEDNEKENYRKVIAVLHDYAAEELIALVEYNIESNIDQFPHEDMHFQGKKDTDVGLRRAGQNKG